LSVHSSNDRWVQHDFLQLDPLPRISFKVERVSEGVEVFLQFVELSVVTLSGYLLAVGQREEGIWGNLPAGGRVEVLERLELDWRALVDLDVFVDNSLTELEPFSRPFDGSLT
jgi:hypothetical protein